MHYGNAVSTRYSLGTSTYKWNNIYAVNGTIQTSDRAKKHDIADLGDGRVSDFIMGLKPVSYKMDEGTSGRTHWGLIAQDIEELMNELGMTSSDFAGFIKSPKVIIHHDDENGNPLKEPIEEVVEGEYEYALRYDEFIAPIIKMVQNIFNKCEGFDKRLKRIEDALGIEN